MMNKVAFDLMRAVDDEFTRQLSGTTGLRGVTENRIHIVAENMRLFVNNYIDMREKMQIDFVNKFKDENDKWMQSRKR